MDFNKFLLFFLWIFRMEEIKIRAHDFMSFRRRILSPPQRTKNRLRNLLKNVRPDISGYPPSIAEITEFLGVASTFGVRKHVDALIRKGFLLRGGSGLSRSLMVARPTMNSGGIRRASSMPILGRVTAGAPILAVEN